MQKWVLFSRQQCHLCDDLHRAALPILAAAEQELEVIDVDSKPELAALYGVRVPVLECDGELVCQYVFDDEAVKQRLA